MKLIKDEESKRFKPFRLTLEVETKSEARLLWHCINSRNLRRQLIDGGYSGMNGTLEDVADYFGSPDVCRYIQQHVEI